MLLENEKNGQFSPLCHLFCYKNSEKGIDTQTILTKIWHFLSHDTCTPIFNIKVLRDNFIQKNMEIDHFRIFKEVKR